MITAVTYLKKEILKHLEERGLEYKDFGCDSEEAVDYPIYARKVTTAIKSGECEPRNTDLWNRHWYFDCGQQSKRDSRCTVYRLFYSRSNRASIMMPIFSHWVEEW